MEPDVQYIDCPHCGHRNDVARYRDAPGRYPGVGPAEYYCEECAKNLNPENTQFAGPHRSHPRNYRRIVAWSIAAIVVCAAALAFFLAR